MPNHLFFGIGLYTMLLWAVNPLSLIYSLKGLLQYRTERMDEDSRIIIGNNWLVFPAILLGSVVLYYLSAGIMVVLTGGA